MNGTYQAGLWPLITLTQYKRHGIADAKPVEAITRDAMAVEVDFLSTIQRDEAMISLGQQLRDLA
jgi:hypothetical protein